MLDRKVKILSLTTMRLCTERGTPIRIRNILYNLSQNQDIQLTVFSADNKKPFDIKHYSLSGNRLADIKKLYSYIKINKIDILIGHTITSWSYLLILKILTRVKTMLEMHGFIEEEVKMNGGISPWKYRLNKFIYSLFYRSCNLITTCSQTATNILIKYNKNVITVFGGTNFNIFNSKIKSVGLIKDKGVIVGYAGNLRKYQGIDDLLEVYQSIKKGNLEFKLKILSSDVVDNEQKKKFKDVEIFAPVAYKDVSKFLIDCDILVIPRPDTEVNRISFPSKLPDYMAMGKAIVSSRTSDVHKIIIDGKNGLLFAPGDKEGLKIALLKLKDKELRQSLGQNAYYYAKEKLTWQKQTSIIYTELLKLL